MDRSAEQYRKMTETPIPKLVLTLGLPTTISMLVTSIYNLADTYFVSEIGTSASGAIGVVFALMGVIQAFGFMFGHGAGSNISRRLGAQDVENACVYASTSLFMGLGAGTLIAVFGLAFQEPFMRLLGSTETILPYSVGYSRYILIAAPAMVASCILNNILRYEGKATFAMFGLVSGGLLNILGDYILIRECGLGIDGAGISTMVSQYIGLFILFLPFLRRRVQSHFDPKLVRIKGHFLPDILMTGLPSLIRQGLGSISTMVLNMTSKPYGDVAIAAMSISSRVIGFMFCVGLGICQGFQPVSAFNFGARKYSRTRKAFFFTVFSGTAILGVIGVFGFILAPQIVQLFRDDPDVITIGTKALRYQSTSLLFMVSAVSGTMLFQSIGMGLKASFLSLLRSGLFFIPMILILSSLFGLAGIECAQAAADVLSGVVTFPLVIAFFRKLPNDGEDMVN
ncbi:MAG: MATE family efflux transporter [Lachnospiraceae bacterium]|nr:MATE family efflux transporter [Lachnospiraceae bacterium]